MSEERDLAGAMGVSAAWFGAGEPPTPMSAKPPEPGPRARSRPPRSAVVLMAALQFIFGAPGASVAAAASGVGAYFLVRAFSASSSDLTVVSGLRTADVVTYPGDLVHGGPPLAAGASQRWAAMCIGDSMVFVGREHGPEGVGGPCPRGDIEKPIAVVDREVTWALPLGLALSLGGALWQALIAVIPMGRRRAAASASEPEARFAA